MTRSTWISMVALAALVQPQVATAQDLASRLVGVWKRTSHVQKELATGVTSNIFGQNPVGPAIFTRGGYFMWTIVADGRKAPTGFTSDADRVALFNTLAFGTGSYKVEGDAIVLRYDSSWNQAWTGTERKVEMIVSGKTLTWTSPTYKIFGDKDAVTVITMERME